MERHEVVHLGIMSLSRYVLDTQVSWKLSKCGLDTPMKMLPIDTIPTCLECIANVTEDWWTPR